MADLLRCPVAGHPAEVGLQLAGRSLVCPTGHRFDVARHGHVNLSGRAQPATADTAAMVAARDRVLSAGHLDVVDEAVAEMLGELPADARVLEVGAGTAHHLARLVAAAPGRRGLASDVSVPACRRAARVHPRVGAVVADTWASWPVRTAGVDALLTVFAPRHAAEAARVLRPGGRWVVVTPEPDHLVELRAGGVLLGIETGKTARLRRDLSGHVEEETATRVRRQLVLGPEARRDLALMGPNGHHLSEAALAGLVGPAAEQTVTVDVRVGCYRRPEA